MIAMIVMIAMIAMKTIKNMNIEEIMKNIENRVINNEPISASDWVEVALRVNTLLSDKDNLIACYEAEMANAEAELVEKGETSSKAKILRTRAVDYKKYLELKGELKRIDEFIKLAKRRAIINEM